MDTILDIAARRRKTTSERKMADDKAEREFDARIAAELKRNPPDLKNTIPWSVVKKRNGL